LQRAAGGIVTLTLTSGCVFSINTPL